jgi:hypothetical protein
MYSPMIIVKNILKTIAYVRDFKLPAWISWGLPFSGLLRHFVWPPTFRDDVSFPYSRINMSILSSWPLKMEQYNVPKRRCPNKRSHETTKKIDCLSVYVCILMRHAVQHPSYVCTVRSESSCAHRLRYVDFVVSIEVVVEVCCCFTVFIC